MRQTGSRGLLSADTSRWDDRALPLLLNTLIIKWSPEGKKIDEGADTERTTLTGPGGEEGPPSEGARRWSLPGSATEKAPQKTPFSLYIQASYLHFQTFFHSPAIKLFQVKLVKTGLDGKRAEFLFSLLNSQKLTRNSETFLDGIKGIFW